MPERAFSLLALLSCASTRSCLLYCAGSEGVCLADLAAMGSTLWALGALLGLLLGRAAAADVSRHACSAQQGP